MSREAMQMALDALIKVGGGIDAEVYFADLAPAINALRAALAEQPEPEPEPEPVDTVPVPQIVAWSGGAAPYRFLRVRLDDTPTETVYVPQRVPLTDEQIKALLDGAVRLPPGWLDFARAIERAHGITGEQE
jgi:hypothetical protein